MISLFCAGVFVCVVIAIYAYLARDYLAVQIMAACAALLLIGVWVQVSALVI